MTCNDFERGWAARLDGDDDPGLARALRDHAEACSACRPSAERLERLGRAIAVWGPPPAPPVDLATRVVAALDRRPAPRVVKLRPALRLAAAAVLVAAGLVGLRMVPVEPEPAPPAPRAAATARPLAAALAEATAATIGLARVTSEPAARVGLGVLDGAELASVEPEGMLPAVPLPVDPPGTWRKVGDRVQSGVGPLSNPVRRGFRFLIDPALKPDDAPQGRPAEGA